MKKLKTLMCICLVFILFLSIFSVSAATLNSGFEDFLEKDFQSKKKYVEWLDSGYKVDDVYFHPEILNNGTWFYKIIEHEKLKKAIVIYAYHGNGTEKKLLIPEKIDGYIVVGIASEVPDGFEYPIYSKGHQCFPIFDNVIESMILPDTIEPLYLSKEYSLPCFKEFIVSDDNKYYSSEGGVLFNKDKTTLIFYPDKKSDTEYVVPDTVKYISDNSFSSYHSYLKKLTIGENVEKLGELTAWTIADEPIPATFDTLVICNNKLTGYNFSYIKAVDEVIVYSNSAVYKYFKEYKEEYGYPKKITVIDNPYIKETKNKKKTAEKVKEKDSSQVESVSEIVSSEEVPTESSVTPIETPEVAKTENTKPKKTAIVVGIVAAAVLVGGAVTFILLKRKVNKRKDG